MRTNSKHRDSWKAIIKDGINLFEKNKREEREKEQAVSIQTPPSSKICHRVCRDHNWSAQIREKIVVETFSEQ